MNGIMLFYFICFFQDEDRAMDIQTVNQNYLLPRNENVTIHQESPVKQIIYNDNNLVSLICFKFKLVEIYYLIFISG